jgi:hypothetical protein
MKSFILDTAISGNKEMPDDHFHEESYCDCPEEESISSKYTDIDITQNSNDKERDKYLKIILRKKVASCQYLLFDNASIQKCIRIQDYTILPDMKDGGYFILYIPIKDGKIDFNYFLHNSKTEILYLQHPDFGKMLEEELDLRLYLQTVYRTYYTKIVGDVYLLHHRNLWNMIQKHKGDLLFYSSQLWMLLS